MSVTPMEKWTQRELLDFHDRLIAARTRARRIDEEADWPGLAPTIVSISERPSFEAGFVWDIRQSGAGLRLFESAIDRSRPGFLEPGYHEMAIDGAALQAILDSLAGAEVPRWFPATMHGGLDGTSYSLSLTSGFSRLRWDWWQDGPEEWRNLTTLVRGLATRFKQLAKAANPIEIDPQRLRVSRRLSFEERGQGVHAGVLPPWLLKRSDVRFLLVVQCVGMNEDIRRQLRGAITIGPAAAIAGIVSRKLPGIPFDAPSTVDDDLPVDADIACFELDRSSDWFTALGQSGGVTAVHVRAGLPSMKIEVWAKRP